MIVASGGPPARVRFVGSTFSVDGATPNEHCNIAPVTTATPMVTSVARVGGTADTGGGSPGCTVPATAWATTEPVTERPVGKTNTQTIVRSLSLFHPSNDGSR